MGEMEHQDKKQLWSPRIPRADNHRREHIATQILAGFAASHFTGPKIGFVRDAIELADLLIKELDN